LRRQEGKLTLETVEDPLNNKEKPLRQDQLDGLVVFVCVAQARGFSAAAVKLGLSPSAVSQAIRNLEQRLRTPLFTRTTRSVKITEAGERYLARVAPAVEELANASDELTDVVARPSGQLRLNVSRAGFLFALRPLLARFLAAYPEIELEISVESRLIDIVQLGFDAGIRYGDMLERDMVGVKIGPSLSSMAVASPEYLERRGRPRHPKDLLSHDCIRYRHPGSGRIDRWLFEKGRRRLAIGVSGNLIVNDDAAMVEAAVAGVGLAYLSSGYVERHIKDGQLVHVLPDWSPAMPSLTLYYPGRRTSRRLQALVEFVRQAQGSATANAKERRRPGRRGARS
jgi:DNA-binding transcriptional LysR family regulator